jgi:hypothetical protein
MAQPMPLESCFQGLSVPLSVDAMDRISIAETWIYQQWAWKAPPLKAMSTCSCTSSISPPTCFHGFIHDVIRCVRRETGAGSRTHR